MYILSIIILLLSNNLYAIESSHDKNNFEHLNIPLIDKSGQLNTKDWYLSHGWYNNGCKLSKEYVSIKNKQVLLKLDQPFKEDKTVFCAEIQSKKFYSYGRYEITMQTVVGSGLNTAFFLYTGPGLKKPIHDEIDYEFLGKYPGTVELNYWKNGITAKPERIKLGFDPVVKMHTYTIEWLPQSLKWFIDGKLVHQTLDKDKIPTEDMKVYVNLWSSTKEHGLNYWMGDYIYTGKKIAKVKSIKIDLLKEE